MNAPINCEDILAKTLCIRKIKRKLIPVKENDTELIFVNKKEDELIRVKIDGCIFPKEDNSVQRCDFMVQHKDINYYVELKTGNPEGACNQIASAIKNLNKCFGDNNCKAIIVVFFPIGTPFIIGFQDQFRAEFKKSNLRKYVRQGICDAPEIIIAPDASYPLS